MSGSFYSDNQQYDEVEEAGSILAQVQALAAQVDADVASVSDISAQVAAVAATAAAAALSESNAGASAGAAATSATTASNAATNASTSETNAASWASAAAASASNASTSETNAASWASAAAASASAASGSASSASGSASTATTQAGNASSSASAAASSASNASTSETNAAASATAAAGSATTASTQAGNAVSSASAASGSASAAASSASNASTSETNAAASATAAAASYDSFDDRYLGSKGADPSVDNDGNALLTGALYWNTAIPSLKVYDGAAWQAYNPVAVTGAPADPDYLVKTAHAGLSAERVVTDTTSITWDWATAGQAKASVVYGTSSGTAAEGNDSRITGAAQKSSNLSDLANAGTARTNLGLGGAAVLSVGTGAGTVAAGDDSRIAGSAQKASNLSDLANAGTARTNLGLGTLATLGTVGTSEITNLSVTYGKIQNVSATDKLLGRATAGAGVIEEIPLTAAGRALIDDADAAAQRATLALSTSDSPQFTAVNIGHATDTTLHRSSAGVVAVEGVDLVKTNGGQTLAGGFSATSYSGGAITGSNQTYTPAAANGNFQHIALNGSSLTGTFALAPPSTVCSIVVQIVNGGSGAVGASFSASGFTKVTGDTWASTNGNKYAAFITKTNSYSHCHLQALQ